MVEAGATDIRCLGLWNPAFGFDVRPAECALVELYRFLNPPGPTIVMLADSSCS